MSLPTQNKNEDVRRVLYTLDAITRNLEKEHYSGTQDKGPKEQEFIQALSKVLDSPLYDNSLLIEMKKNIEEFRTILKLLEPYNGAGQSVIYGIVRRLILELENNGSGITKFSLMLKMCQ